MMESTIKTSFSSQINEIIKKSRKAQIALEKETENFVDKLVLAIGWGVLKKENNQFLSQLAVEKTGLGNVADKKIKNYRKTLGLLRDLKKARTFGIIENNQETGIIKIARPKGVIASITPSTNPIATPVNNIINAIKCRNAIILAPSPKGEPVLKELLNLIFQELKKLPLFPYSHLIQKLPAPIDRELTNELMQQADSLIVTGSAKNVNRSYKSGTPSFGVGTGNVVVIIDETANLKTAVQKIESSKTFDNATSCSSENSAVVLKKVYNSFMAHLEEVGGVILNEKEKNILEKELWQEKKLNSALIAKSGKFILEKINPHHKDLHKVRFLVIEENKVGQDYLFSQEKLSPILTVYKVKDFQSAINQTNEILNHQGKGHSCGIHTENPKNVERLGFELPVCRVIVNQAHCFATGGNFNNGLPFSLSMGCGSWGNNSSSENINYKHYLNITQISYPIKNNEPRLKDIYHDYWEEHGQ